MSALDEFELRLRARLTLAREVLDREGFAHVAALVPIEEVLIWIDEVREAPAEIDKEPVARWLEETGAAFAREVNRLWPHENNPAYRGACLAEEAGEVDRAITKRRHAMYADDGTCKGLSVSEWSNELRKELAQALGVVLDIARREEFDVLSDVTEALAKLQDRETGT